MSYWQLNGIFLAIVAAVGCLALLRELGPARGRRSLPLAAVLLALVLLLLSTAGFDNVMIGVGLVGYDRAKISGAFIGLAPLEDFAYPVAAAILLPSLWILLGRGSRRVDRLSESDERS